MVINENNVEVFEKFFEDLVECNDYYDWLNNNLNKYKKLIVEVVGEYARNDESKWIGAFLREIIDYMLNEEEFTMYLEDVARLFHLYITR